MIASSVRYANEGHLSKEWSEVTREVADISTASHRASTYVTKLKVCRLVDSFLSDVSHKIMEPPCLLSVTQESWQHLLRDRASRTLTYNDEQFHILEKIKMTETIRVIAELLTKECEPSVVTRTEALADWYKMASTIYLQTEILYKDLTAFQVGPLVHTRLSASFSCCIVQLIPWTDRNTSRTISARSVWGCGTRRTATCSWCGT